jgi:hypothetical protein
MRQATLEEVSYYRDQDVLLPLEKASILMSHFWIDKIRNQHGDDAQVKIPVKSNGVSGIVRDLHPQPGVGAEVLIDFADGRMEWLSPHEVRHSNLDGFGPKYEVRSRWL